MHNLFSKFAMTGMVAGALTLGGCASVDSVQHAQATADSASSQAQTASAAAQKAQATADQASTDVRAVDAKLDQFIAEERSEAKSERHHHVYHRHYRHHRHHK